MQKGYKTYVLHTHSVPFCASIHDSTLNTPLVTFSPPSHQAQQFAQLSSMRGIWHGRRGLDPCGLLSCVRNFGLDLKGSGKHMEGLYTGDLQYQISLLQRSLQMHGELAGTAVQRPIQRQSRSLQGWSWWESAWNLGHRRCWEIAKRQPFYNVDIYWTSEHWTERGDTMEIARLLKTKQNTMKVLILWF